ncbi:taste receptor type 1 member 2 [Sceloporus undulatus]|uniref:taste receptor type 1 member 2 n=1 Tax=Sceloporus undulatus TaxID=8520 RepID=UPI001C4B5D8D|nr:taste receptor type 1 member 2 [Sceloporus undulatus]
MRFAVEEINNSSLLLPGISLGYEILDVCSLTNTIHPLFYFLSDNRSVIEVKNNYTDSQTRVVAVIGPDSTSTAITAAYLLSLFLVPQITYSATTEALSNPRTFPVAFRTIPSTDQQIRLILTMMRYFRWNWFVVLSSEDEYGQQNLQLLHRKLGQLRTQDAWICVAFQENIPIPETSQPDGNSANQERLRDVVTKVSRSSAKVVIVLSTELPLRAFFQEVISQNLTGLVWIASEAWSTDLIIYSMPNISSIGTVFGVAVEEVPVPELDRFQVRSGPTEGKEAPAAHMVCNQKCDNCLRMVQRYESAFRSAGDRVAFNVYSSVYVIAHALHALLGCSETKCSKRKIYPWQLLREVARVNFTLLNTTICFDDKGDPPNGFELVQWQWGTPEKPFKTIASYQSPEEDLQVYDENIIWHTENSTPPKSVCSEQCAPGQKRKPLGSLACCFVCVECTAGTFLNKSDNFTCQSCPPNMWSKPGQEECFMKEVMYLFWNDPFTIMLLFCALIGLLASVGTLVTFARHFNTPVVRSAGGHLCFLMITSLGLGFCSVFFYIGDLTELKCFGRQSAFGLCFTLCISCITVRSFQIICVFKMAARLPRVYGIWKKYNGQHVFVASVFAVKMVIVGLNVYFYPPAPVLTMINSNPTVLLLMCTEEYKSSMVLNNALEMALCFLCFCFAYMGKALPKNYNEAKYITLCMTGYFSFWAILLLVMSISSGILVNIVDTAIMLANLFSVGMGYFGPKCYVIFFHPERNTAAFFQEAIQSYTMRQE